MKIPDDWTYETASQLGISALTAAQTLWESHNLPKPYEDKAETSSSGPTTILVWSGASATGHFVIQFAKSAGLKVITSASPKHFDRLKALGADQVYDYNDPEVASNIRNATGNTLKYAIDCISEASTIQKVIDSLSEEGGAIASLLPYPDNLRKGVTVKRSVVYNLLYEVCQNPILNCIR